VHADKEPEPLNLGVPVVNYRRLGERDCPRASAILARAMALLGGLGYFNSDRDDTFSYPEPFLRAVRRGALAKSKTGNHKNMVKDIYVVANQMPV
jgi:hypothetical protein